MKSMWQKLSLVFVCLVILSATARPALAADNVVLQWNSVILQSVRNTRLGPPMVARALAIIHTAMYDAWAAYDPIAVGTQLGGSLRRPAAEHTLANKEKAVSFAAYRALVDLFPTEQALFDSLMASLGYDPSDNSTDTSTASGIGNTASAAVLATRHHDGSNQLGDLNPGAYSDYTGYRPVNTPDKLSDPNRWQPLRQPNGQAQVFLVPHWGFVDPFAMTVGSQFRPKGPALFPADRYRKQAEDVLRLSGKLTDRDKAIAEYWADGPATETPPGHWNLFAQQISRRDNHSLDDDVKLFFALGNVLLDASIAVWEAKVIFDYIRPVSAIRFLFKGQRVPAWGGPFQGTRLIDGANFQSYIGTPPFAEYVSGHSTFSSSSAEILRLFTGSDFFGGAVTIPAGSSRIEPGLTPTSEVVLSWATFTDAANEAGLSRRLGGIHFEDGDLGGRNMGRQIAALVWLKALEYFNGTAAQ